MRRFYNKEMYIAADDRLGACCFIRCVIHFGFELYEKAINEETDPALTHEAGLVFNGVIQFDDCVVSSPSSRAAHLQ